VSLTRHSEEPPIACTLDGGSYQDRIAWIAELARDGLRRHTRTDLTLELRYAPEVAAKVHEMVDKERQCCAFLSFEMTENRDAVQLKITAPERARDAVDVLFEQFLPSSTVSAGGTSSAGCQTCCSGDGETDR
jgi:hypothetical protein